MDLTLTSVLVTCSFPHWTGLRLVFWSFVLTRVLVSPHLTFLVVSLFNISSQFRLFYPIFLSSFYATALSLFLLCYPSFSLPSVPPPFLSSFYATPLSLFLLCHPPFSLPSMLPLFLSSFCATPLSLFLLCYPSFSLPSVPLPFLSSFHATPLSLFFLCPPPTPFSPSTHLLSDRCHRTSHPLVILPPPPPPTCCYGTKQHIRLQTSAQQALS